MINILVTGKNGQLGNCIQEETQFLSVYNNVQFHFVFKGREELDITSAEQIDKALSVVHYDYIINCAAYTDVNRAENEIELSNKINAEGPKLLAEYCAKYKTRLIHISTEFVFDGKNEIKYESSPTYALNQYGYSKELGEKNIIEVAKNNPDFEYMIIRTSWLYSKYGNNFVKAIYNKILQGIEFNVVCDQVGSPTCANNLAKCIIDIIEKCSDDKTFISGCYNYSDDGVISRFDFAKAIEEFIDKHGNVVKPCLTSDYQTNVVRPLYSVWSKKQLSLHYDIKFNYWKTSLFRTLLKIV